MELHLLQSGAGVSARGEIGGCAAHAATGGDAGGRGSGRSGEEK